MRRELAILLVALGACGSVTPQALTLADGAAGSSAAGGTAGAAIAGAAGSSSSGAAGAAGAVVTDAGVESAAHVEGGPLPGRCLVASFATSCWSNLSTDVGCLQGCKDSNGDGVVGEGCSVNSAPHHATCVEYCSACPPAN